MTNGFKEFTTASEVKKGVAVILRSESTSPQHNPFATLIVAEVKGETYKLSRPYMLMLSHGTHADAETIVIDGFRRFSESVVGYATHNGDFYSFDYYDR